VAELEARVAKLVAELEDSDLYTKPDGVKRSKQVGQQLDAARRELDRALDAWTAATEAAERWGAARS